MKRKESPCGSYRWKVKISQLKTDMKTKRRAQRVAFEPYSKYKEGRPTVKSSDVLTSDEKLIK